MPPKFNRSRAVFVLEKIDEILAWEQRKRDGARHQVRRTGALSMRGAGGTVLEGGDLEVVRRVPGEAVPGIAEEGVLPDVDPREPATAGEEGVEEGGLGEGARVGEAGAAGPAELRLCNLVAQSS